MSNYCPLYTSIWNDAKFTEYTPEQQLIFIYLISNPSCKLSGIYQISPKQISYSTNIDINKTIDSLKEFHIDTLEYDAAVGVIFIKNHFKHNLNKIGNPKTMLQSLLKSSDLTEHDDFWKMFIEKYNKKIINLVTKIKDFSVNKNNDSILNKFITDAQPNKHKGSFHTESSVDPHLISISISNKSNSKDIKEVKDIVSDQFQEFWDLYNYKKSKPKALAAYKKALKSDNHNNIITGVNNYIKTRGEDKQYWKHPTTWLNAEAWNDEYITSKPTQSKQSSTSELITRVTQRMGGKMRLERFSKNIELMAENFGFKISNEEWLEMLFRMVDKFSDEDIKYGFQEMCRITQEEWNKRYGYNGKPAIADWVNFFSLRSKHNILKEKDQKISIAVNNAKNGKRTRKTIKYENNVSDDKIKDLISNLSKNLTIN